MARVVVGDGVGEAGSDVGHVGARQELSKLKYAFAERQCVGVQGAGAQQLRVKIADHGGTGAGRADDGFRSAAHADETLGDRPRLAPEAGVKGGLSATGLFFGEVELVTEAP